MKNTSTAPMSYVGRACLGFVLSRGRAGFEAFDPEERSLGRRVLVLEIKVWAGRDWNRQSAAVVLRLRLANCARGRWCHERRLLQMAARHAARNIATFPVSSDKRPCIKGWQKVGLKGSAKLANKFADASALGFVTGRRSNVTVLDIDTTDERVAEDAIRRHGQPAIITRTASGKHLHRTDVLRRPRMSRLCPLARTRGLRSVRP